MSHSLTRSGHTKRAHRGAETLTCSARSGPLIHTELQATSPRKQIHICLQGTNQYQPVLIHHGKSAGFGGGGGFCDL